MENKYLTNIDVNEMNIVQLESITSDTPIEHKQEILMYLKSFPECAFTSQPVYDKFTKQNLDSVDNAITDGIYTWYKSEIYYFEKYNLKLNNDFIEYVLDKIRN